MKNIDRLIDAYSKMDQRRRDECLIIMEAAAAAHPAKAPRVTHQLHLVADNSESHVSRHRLGRAQDSGAPIIVSGAKKGQ